MSSDTNGTTVSAIKACIVLLLVFLETGPQDSSWLGKYGLILGSSLDSARLDSCWSMCQFHSTDCQ